MFRRLTSPIALLVVTLVLILIVTSLGPAEKTLGVNVRVVYLHGAWVWTALAGFGTAAAAGLAGLLGGRELFHRWSRALGRTALVFWVTFLPMSVLAMQTNWNGLFLAEPRWRMALNLATAALLLQVGLSLLPRPIWTSLGNLAFGAFLLVSLSRVENVMHPASPILTSDSLTIKLYFFGLLALTLLAAAQVARLWMRLERPDIRG